MLHGLVSDLKTKQRIIDVCVHNDKNLLNFCFFLCKKKKSQENILKYDL